MTRNTAVRFDIDFDKKILSGSVVLTLESLTEGESKEIVLDTSFLDVSDVKIDGKKVEWAVKYRVEPYGSPLVVKLNESLAKGKNVDLSVSQ